MLLVGFNGSSMWIKLHFKKSSTYIILLTKVLMGTEWQYFVAGLYNSCLGCEYFVLLMKNRASHFTVMWPRGKPVFLRKEHSKGAWIIATPFPLRKCLLGKVGPKFPHEAVWSLL